MTKDKNKTEVSTEVMEDILATAGEGVDYDTSELQIPFVRVIQALSPQVKKSDSAFIKDAAQGDLFNTVTGEFWKGEKGIVVIPCYQETKYLEFIPRDQGGGFVGEIEVDSPVLSQTTRDRSVELLPNGNQLQNTANFYVLMAHPTMGLQKALICMSSTQLKKAKKWLTQAQSLMAEGKNGMFVLPLCSSVYKLVSVAEKNEKGNWFGFEVSRERGLNLDDHDDSMLFKHAVSFSQSVKAGEVSIKDETLGHDSKDQITDGLEENSVM